jgi:hypothetical protein
MKTYLEEALSFIESDEMRDYIPGNDGHMEAYCYWILNSLGEI